MGGQLLGLSMSYLSGLFHEFKGVTEAAGFYQLTLDRKAIDMRSYHEEV